MRLLDMPARLAKFNVPYVEVNGWQGRGSDMGTLYGAVNHHTAGASHGVTPSLGTVINGRPDLSGPLCNILLGRDLVAYVVAGGKANHAGVGNLHGRTGNSHFFGLEVEHVGTSAEAITPQRVDTMAHIHAALADGQYGADSVVQHWEYATPAGRKVDFCHFPGGLDAEQFRVRVADLLAHGVTPPAPTSWNLGTFPGVTLSHGMTATSTLIRNSIRDYKLGLSYLGFKVPMAGAAMYQFDSTTDKASRDLKALYFGATGKPMPARLGGEVGPVMWNWAKLCIADKNSKSG